MNTGAHVRRRKYGRASVLFATGISMILSLSVLPAQATYPGNNGKIFYGDWHEDPVHGAGYDIFAVDPISNEVTRVTDLPGGDIYGIKISPDGQTLLFTYLPWRRTTDDPYPDLGDRHPRADLYTVRVDGSNLTRLTRTPRNELMPSWSPDGRHIAYVGRDSRKNRQIFVMRARPGARPRQVTSGESWVWFPEWAPDRDRIAYTINTSHGASEIFTISSNGRHRKRITHGAYAVAPTWSPDGERLIFFDWRNVFFDDRSMAVCYKPTPVTLNWATGPCDLDIYSIKANGRDERRLTDAPGADMYPTWSPDGTQIAFVSDRGGAPWYPDVWVMNADGTNQRMVVNTPGDIWLPSWQSVRP